ncbi:MAG: hypothetical protein NC415_12510 [bacterium]|nr:hypothetical protein [bacterium]
MEYKSPEDHLDIDTFYKTSAYASLYKSYGKTTDEIKADDVTVSVIREAKPVKLLQYLKEHGYSLTNPYSGIYYIGEKVLFPTQIVVTGELEQKGHIWLKALSDRLEKADMWNLIDGINQLTEKADKELADSVLEVSIGANKQTVEKMMGDDTMCQALMEIMEPAIHLRDQRNIEKGLEQGLAQGIRLTIDTLREFGHRDPEIKTAIMKKYDIPAEEVNRYL